MPSPIMHLAWSLLLLAYPIALPAGCSGPQTFLSLAPSFAKDALNVSWTPCGFDNPSFECATVTVPLDYRNLSSAETIELAITRLKAASDSESKGGLFLVPGGPGLSGIMYAQMIGPGVWDALQGRYDLLGVDPRGVAKSQPHVSCFQSKLDSEVFRVKTSDFGLNIPASIHPNHSSVVHKDIERQLDFLAAYGSSAGNACAHRTGHGINYLDTESVARDIDYIAKLLYGEQAPLNFWGFSYGAVIGQYVTAILPPERLGHIIIDGVPDALAYVSPEINRIADVGVDADATFYQFAKTCSATRNTTLCALASLDEGAIVRRIDQLIDDTFSKPAPLLHRGVPGIVSAREVRRYVFNALYSMSGWSAVASGLAQALFEGNFSTIAKATLPSVHGDAMNDIDAIGLVEYLIVCADPPPFGSDRPRPPTAEIAEIVMENLENYSARFSDQQNFFYICQFFTEDAPGAHRYEGNFSIGDSILRKPILVISNEFDSVSPLRQAKRVAKRLGGNARFVEQRGGYGHCSIGQVTFRTAELVRDFLLYDVVPSESHTIFDVDERPFALFDDTPPASAGRVLDETDLALWEAWKAAGKATHSMFALSD